jgi:hypothetical protein
MTASKGKLGFLQESETLHLVCELTNRRKTTVRLFDHFLNVSEKARISIFDGKKFQAAQKSRPRRLLTIQ